MAQEFTINSTAIESKINQLLPSQGGFGAGVDFSASTMVIPIVDLTETAEGSDVRIDLQSGLSHKTITSFSVNNATNTVLVTTTGYYRVFGVNVSSGVASSSFNLFDGASSKDIITYASYTGSQNSNNFDFIIKLEAGDSLRVTAANAQSTITGNTRQIADINGNLTDP